MLLLFAQTLLLYDNICVKQGNLYGKAKRKKSNRVNDFGPEVILLLQHNVTENGAQLHRNSNTSLIERRAAAFLALKLNF